MEITTTPESDHVVRRRLAMAFGAVVVVLSLLFGGFAPTASAESPPADPYQFDLMAPPVPENDHEVTSIAFDRGDNWFDGHFTSTAPQVSVQVSTQKPWTGPNGYPTLGAAPVQPLVGTLQGGNPGMIVGNDYEPTFSYDFSRDALVPDTKYYVLITMHGTWGQEPNFAAYSTVTKQRFVRMTPMQVTVHDDSDGAGKGAGEISFGFRVAPEGNALGYSKWGSWTPEYKLNSGDVLDLGFLGYGHTVTTRSNSAVVQVQGIEDDSGWPKNCALEGGEWKPEQWSDKCYQLSYTSSGVGLPTGRYEGVHSQQVVARTSRSSLDFSVIIKVDTWAA